MNRKGVSKEKYKLYFKKETKENSNLKTTVTEMKILLCRLSRVEMAEERISELEGRSIEIIQSEE